MNRAFPIAFAVLLGLLAPGCADSAAAPETVSCEGAGQCDGTLGCSYGYCVEPMVHQVALHARVLTPPGSPYLQQLVPDFVLGNEPALTIQLVQTAELTGVVRNTGDAFVSNLPGEIEARASGSV